MRIFASKEQRDQWIASLKCSPCPHCKQSGALNRHGFLRGYDEEHFKQKAIRALRVFCSNRGNSAGCGRTFSVWGTDKVQRLFLDAESLFQFLDQAATDGNRAQAFRNRPRAMSDSAPYRIWKRFLHAQAAIRTALTDICPPPKHPSEESYLSVAQGTIAHLKEAFRDSTLNPIATYQAQTQSFFI